MEVSKNSSVKLEKYDNCYYSMLIELIKNSDLDNGSYLKIINFIKEREQFEIRVASSYKKGFLEKLKK